MILLKKKVTSNVFDFDERSSEYLYLNCCHNLLQEWDIVTAILARWL